MEGGKDEGKKGISKILSDIQLYFPSQNFKTPLKCDVIF